ncbi:MAG: hypothetical protein R2781_11465 [Flavobacteriaceae bacterium]
MTSNKTEEIDLLYLFRKIRSIYTNWLLNLYRFIVRFWYVIILVLVSGYLLGLYLEKTLEKTKETQILVQINFDAVDYVYDAVGQLKKKINEGDGTALSELKEDFDNLFNVMNIEIEPIPDVRDLDNDMDPNNRNVDTFLEKSKYEDDLLLSEMFVSQYKLHRITLTTASATNPKIVYTILKYLNNNAKFNEIREVGVKNLKNEIAESQQSISEIDSVMIAYGTVLGDQNKTGSVYVNTSSNVNMHFLIQEKTNLVHSLQKLETDLIRCQDGIVSLVNKPMLQKKASFLNRTSLLMPIIFFFFFSAIVYVVHLFRKLAKIDKETQKE